MPKTTAASEYLDGTYLAKNETWHAEDSAWKARQIRQMLVRHDIEPRTVAEVGCGAGAILHHLSRMMPQTQFTGYEVSPQAFALCKPSERVHFALGEIRERVDCLLCIDVFEHVDDYLGFLRGLRGMAAATVFHIPLDMTVLGLLRGTMLRSRRDVGHLHYFNTDTAVATLEYCGFRVVDSYFTAAFRDRPGQSRLARLARLPRAVLYALSPRALATWLGGVSLLVLAE